MSRFEEIELPEWASVTACTALELAGLPESVSAGAEAAIALALARKLDSGGEMSVAPVSKELREVLGLLRSRASACVVVKEAGGIADLSARIAARRGPSAG